MGEQQTFAGLAWSGKKRQTRRERFLAEMNAVIPWAELQALIAPHYPTGAGGRRAMPLERMLRVYFLQHWYDLSDPAAEDALYDSEAMRRFVGVDLGDHAVRPCPPFLARCVVQQDEPSGAHFLAVPVGRQSERNRVRREPLGCRPVLEVEVISHLGDRLTARLKRRYGRGECGASARRELRARLARVGAPACPRWHGRVRQPHGLRVRRGWQRPEHRRRKNVPAARLRGTDGVSGGSGCHFDHGSHEYPGPAR